jgi:hypothetical protein
VLDDGLPSLGCWHGVYCVLRHLIAKYLHEEFSDQAGDGEVWRIPVFGYPEGRGAFPCGDRFPRQQLLGCASAGRVDFVFVPSAVRIRLPAEEVGLPTLGDAPIYDSARYTFLEEGWG